MKVIFIFNLAYKTPFFYELVDKLYKSGIDVVVFDFISSKKYLPDTKQIQSLNPFFGAKLILRIKYVRRLFIPFINKQTIAKNFGKTDIVNIHYVHIDYLQYVRKIKKKVATLIVTFWGSDFLRANDATRLKYIPMLNECDKITMVKGIQNEFKKKYNDFDHKIKTSFFGLSQLDLIRKVDFNSIEKFKKEQSLKGGVIFITIGYNASPAQQHLWLIDKLNNLEYELKIKIHLLVPLSYGGDEIYIKQIIENLEKSTIKYTCFTKYLNEEDLASLRVISNITLNIQKTDAFSGSISEYIVAKNIVLVGDWLPYEIYDDWDVKIFKAKLDDYEKKMIDIIQNYKYYYKKIEGNSKKVYSKLSWDTILPQWEKLYQDK